MDESVRVGGQGREKAVEEVRRVERRWWEEELGRCSVERRAGKSCERKCGAEDCV